MKCSTNKRCFLSKEIAEEALLENRTRNHYGSGQGPINVYQCHECGYYHFTSKGEVSDNLKSETNKKKIDHAREASYWEEKYKHRR